MTSFRHDLKKNKYRNTPTRVDGIRFDSKKEANYYKDLKAIKEHKDGGLIMFLRQTPFHLPGEPPVIYRLDFMEFWEDGRVKFVDVKGRDTPMSKLKRKQVEALYHVTIDLA